MDHVEDVKEEPSAAGLGIGSPNDEGIVLVAAADVVPTTCQICGLRTYGPHPLPYSGQTRRGRGLG